MVGHVSQIFGKLGSVHNWNQDAYHRKGDPDSTELFLLSTQKPDDRSLFDARDSEIQPPKSTDNSWFHRLRRRFTGWRFGVLQFATWAFIVFLINLSATIWASSKTGGDLSEGDCGRIKNLNRGLHILINILSTILLSGSNYCMQCLSAPTRADIDKAHEARRWLDVGIPSIRNLKHISRPRLYLWLLLGFSSVPLHLLYNSAIYATTSTNSYQAFVVNEAFLSGDACSECSRSNLSDDITVTSLQNMWKMSQNDSLESLDPMKCLTEYATTIQSNRRNLLLVTDDIEYHNTTYTSVNNARTQLSPYIYGAYEFLALDGLDTTLGPNSFAWVCSGLISDENCVNQVKEVKSTSPWKVEYWSIKRCLSEPVVAQCKLRFSKGIATIVTVLNIVKAVLMVCVVYCTRSDPILTMGDAVASFIDKRDITTTDSGMLGVKECGIGYSANARPWERKLWRWKDTTSKGRRGLTLLLYTTILIIVLVLLIWGARSVSAFGNLSVPAVFGLGFGAVDTRAIIGPSAFPNNLVIIVLVANSPQVVLSFCYFAYNGLFTAMLMGYEWTSYADKRKGLRVSVVPTGSQRSTYFLQLPYRFSLPLVILSGTLHWLVSQCIFVVSLDLYNQLADFSGGETVSVNRCGYSPIAMLAVTILGTIMVVAVVGFGYIPYKSDMPLVASCSLAISAACHPEEKPGSGDAALSEQKLQWGVVSVDQEGIGHCAFSSKEVEPLIKGAMYR